LGSLGLCLYLPILGTDGIIKKIRDRVGTDNPVYLSIDIDTLDPACEYRVERRPLRFVGSVAKNICSRTGYWHPRDWRLVYTRAADYHPWSRWAELYWSGYC
jgi:hypothetical protein